MRSGGPRPYAASYRAFLFVLTGVLLACGGEYARDWQRGDTAAMIADTTEAPRDSVGGVGVEPDDSPGDHETAGELVTAADSAAGDAIFHRKGRCFTCHGSAGEGMPRLGPSLRDGVWLHGDGSLHDIEQSIARGVGEPRVAPIAMPGYSRELSQVELGQVAAYVYSLSRAGAVLGDPPAERAAEARDTVP